MDEKRKLWNQKQQALRQALAKLSNLEEVRTLFLDQHAMLHSGELSGLVGQTFDDEMWFGLSDAEARMIPGGMEHSIAWCLWHLARIEDITMNMLLFGTSQLLSRDDWFQRLGTSFKDTGNGMNQDDVRRLSDEIDINHLRTYRKNVGSTSREIVRNITLAELTAKVDPARLENVIKEGAVVDAGRYVVDYWSDLTGMGLLLMPPTRHNLIHLNEALKLKKRLQKDRKRVLN